MNRKMRTRDAKANQNLMTAIFVSVFVMFVISGVLLLLLALLLYKMQLTESTVKIGIIIIYIITGAAGGFLAGKMIKRQKYLWGLAAGVLYYLMLFIVSVVVKGGFELDIAKIVTTMVICVASGMVGGMIS